MTQKELLYVEDAIGHETNIIAVCNETMNLLEDSNLISFLRSETKKHTAMKEKLMKVLEDVASV